MTDQQTAFVESVLPYAKVASAALGIPVSPILAQWINETGAGTSEAWLRGNNFAGVSNLEDHDRALNGAYCMGGPIICYPSLPAGLLGYIARWRDPVYQPTRARWGTNPSPIAVAEAIQDSPWAAGHYDHHGLVDLIDQLDLTKYDHPGSGGDPNPSPVPKPGPVPPDLPCSELPPGPAPAGHPTLRIGAHGPAVAELQAELATRGYPPASSHRENGTWDGIFGPGTAAAVAEVQETRGLRRDGIVGRQTWCVLGVH